MFVLVRTDAARKKQQGITFVLIDMNQPGVEVRPIKLISGASPFCETFFTDARAHAKDVIHGVGKGWTVAKALLGHERNMIGSVFGGRRRAARRKAPRKNPLAELAREYVGERDGQIADPVLRDRVTQISMDERCFVLTVQRNADNVKAGHRPGAGVVDLQDLRHRAQPAPRGADARRSAARRPRLGGPRLRRATSSRRRATWLRSRGNTIEGGTSEVQLNIIAKRVLDLPD